MAATMKAAVVFKGYDGSETRERVSVVKHISLQHACESAEATAHGLNAKRTADDLTAGAYYGSCSKRTAKDWGLI